MLSSKKGMYRRSMALFCAEIKRGLILMWLNAAKSPIVERNMRRSAMLGADREERVGCR